jgi:DNA-binding HxlR family transcriptional regulator
MNLRVIANKKDAIWIVNRILQDVQRGLINAQFRVEQFNHLCDITFTLRIALGLASFPSAVTAINPVFSFILTDIKSEARASLVVHPHIETKGRRRQPSIDLATITAIKQSQPCDFEGTDALSLMAETARLRKLITKRGTLEILIPLCCTTNPVRYMKFKQTLKGFSSKTLAKRLKELEGGGILERQAYHEIPPRVEYRLTTKGQELVESIISLLQWMRKWSKQK